MILYLYLFIFYLFVWVREKSDKKPIDGAAYVNKSFTIEQFWG